MDKIVCQKVSKQWSFDSKNDKSKQIYQYESGPFCRGKYKQGFVMQLCGMPETGKSTLVKKFIETFGKKSKSQIFILSSVNGIDPTYKQLEKDGFFVQWFDQQNVKEGLILDLIEFFKREREQNYEKEKNKKKKITYVKYFLVIDDCPVSNQIQHDQLSLLLRTYRHLGGRYLMQIFITCQNYTIQNKLSLRQLINVDVIFGQQTMKSLKQQIFENLRTTLSLDDFLKIYQHATEGNDHPFLLIDSRCNKGKVIFQKNLDYVYLFPGI